MATLPGDQFITTKSALLNIGNLRNIFALGEEFDGENCTV